MARSRIEGVREVRTLYRNLPPHLRGEIQDVMVRHTVRVWSSGLANMDAMITPRTGLMRRTYKKRVQFQKDRVIGRVGYITTEDRRAAYYVRWVHDGSKHLVSRPFHEMAVEQWSEPYRVEMREALRRVIADLRGVGGPRAAPAAVLDV